MKKETVQKSHEMYKKKIEEKKLADEMIIHDIHLTPMIFDADSSFYYTYFKINSLKDWELLKKVYDIHPLKMQVTNFPEIIIAESWFDLSERIDNLLNFMLDGERDTEFGIKEADYGNRVLCTSREDAEKYIEKTKLILEIHSRGLREKDFSLSQLHELQNYLERTEK